MADQKDSQKKEAFVGQQDRPDVQLNPDEPITNLRVRDLAALLAPAAKATDKNPAELWPPKTVVKDVHDSHTKFVLKDIHDNKTIKDIKDYVDTLYQVPPWHIGPDPVIHQAIDKLVKEVAQLREEVNQFKR